MKLKKLGALLLVGTLSIGLTACGGKTDEEGADKGGSKSNAEKLVGKWSLDVPATLAQLEAEAKTEEEKADVEMAKKMMPLMEKLQMEFTADGKMIMSMPNPISGETKAEEGTYEVKSTDGDTVVITGTIKGDPKDVTAKFTGDDSVALTVPEEDGPETMVLKRVK